MTIENAVKVGLIGLGNMGQNHLRVLSMLKKVDLRFIFDADEGKATSLARDYAVNAVKTLDDAVLSSVDAVIICTPTSTHAEYIRKVAPHVKNIFIEKPMAVDLKEAEDVCRTADAHGNNIQVGFIERFNPAVQKLKSILDTSKGVINIDFTRTNKLSDRIKDVDVISDLMIHDIDLALYLNGPVSSLFAYGTTQEGGGYVSFASAVLTHENGRFSRVLASRSTEKKMRKIEATCDGAFIDCELVRKEILVNRQSEIHHNEGESYRVSAIQESIEVKPQEALLLELQAFIAGCSEEGGSHGPTRKDGYDAITVCEQIRQRILSA